jgi:hypothetical protein
MEGKLLENVRGQKITKFVHLYVIYSLKAKSPVFTNTGMQLLHNHVSKIYGTS